ncbi:MAG: 3-deoxy-D-manno-octulosonic acid transferase, partial [Planctomycetales bacterium]
MLKYLINTCYLLLLTLIAPYLLYASIRKGKYREGWAAKFLGRVPRRSGNQSCIWFHAVSVGEIQLLDGLIRNFRQRAPNIEFVISTTTQTGHALARKKYPQHHVFYCPLDFSWSVQAALNRIRPDMLVLAELELWPNLISLAHQQGVRVAVANGRLSDQSFRGYRPIRPLVARMLQSMEWIAAQNGEYAQRFIALGANPDCVSVTGSMKFDGAITDRGNSKTSALAALAQFDDDDVIFLAGSTQRPEERLAIDTFNALCVQYPQLRLVLVPRHPERFDEVAQLLDDRGLPWQRRSQLEEPPSKESLS